MQFCDSAGRVAVQVLRGHEAISEKRRLLAELAARSGQAELLSDIPYYLAKPGVLKRTPVLLLMSRSTPNEEEKIFGAVLLFEYSIGGIPSGMYTSNDRSGRRTVIAELGERAEVAAIAAEYLLEQGAHVVMLSFRSGVSPGATCALLSRDTPRDSWLARQREVPDYLALRKSFDETLAGLGKRTRTHMRYYRRRAEAELGVRFDPAPAVRPEDVLRFNHECMYAVSDRVALWRVSSLGEFDDPILMALWDRDGRWLSLLGGRRLHGGSEVLWQMNRRDLPNCSISLVMRTYFIEHEIARGAQRIYFDGGSAHSISHSFEKTLVTDFAALRRTPLTFLARKLARRLIPWDNELAHLLVAETSAEGGNTARIEQRDPLADRDAEACGSEPN